MPRSRTLRSIVTAVALAGSLAFLAACDSAEVRAQKHYEAGMVLLAKGDVDRALVEFRNVFKLNNMHRDARLAYARTERERGNLREAYAQYLRLVEQYPEDMEGLLALAEIAAQASEWEEADRYAALALTKEPDNQSAQAVRIATDYGRAKAMGEDAKIDENARKAEAQLAKSPDSLFLLGVIIDHQLRAQDYAGTLKTIERALKIAPDDRGLYAMRLSTLAAMNDDKGVEEGLIEMIGRFPDDAGIPDALVRWYIARKELDRAEAFLRGRVDIANPDQTATLELIRFLTELRGGEQAIAEIDRLIEAGSASPIYRSARAGLVFDLGRHDEAIADMQAILKDAAASDDTRKMKVGLAQMLALDGNQVGSRALVEEVLAEDSGNVEALKLKGRWLIDADEMGEALATLRAALQHDERNPEVLTMMAQAYERDGNRDLMREMLSLAVDAADKAPDESLRYASLLITERNYLTAESVLIEALKLAPATPSLLITLGDLYIRMKDWPRADAVAESLTQIGDAQAKQIATELKAAVLQGQQQTDQAIGYLQSLVDTGVGGLAPKIAIIRAHLANDQKDRALAYANDLLNDSPNDPSLRFIRASVQSASGQNAAAEQEFRALLAEDPQRLQVWMALFRSVASEPARTDDAGKVLDEALAAFPDTPDLLWAQAGHLERKGDIEGAISVYEGLYARDSANSIVANNLASLLASYRTDAESLARAEVISRRLKGSDVPAFQDTYGWVAYRLGNVAEAVANLEAAAAALTGDPLVQFHLGMAYSAAGDTQMAKDQLGKAIAMVSADSPLPFVAEAKAELGKLEAGAAASGN
ncbi:MAG: tetratricopeptide repeat protein [Paracoccaceae bacterium]